MICTAVERATGVLSGSVRHARWVSCNLCSPLEENDKERDVEENRHDRAKEESLTSSIAVTCPYNDLGLSYKLIKIDAPWQRNIATRGEIPRSGDFGM